ncbi:hypothetical protein H2198_008573 [Neophaeococcomyces mojaviensis]|uniref:Uncharacterized protein n=1 Tax=Neophaeococcomyces mojaviensis TaxID=3383035 RepID=A0ACC2ZWY5_9EURO|nr:hypothetical protein H2198_008573 [Knufia sp. JES_112]
MSDQTSSPALKATRQKAPRPSAALLALREKGFELSESRVDSISPLHSYSPPDASLRVSPLSIVSTPSDLDRSFPLRSGERWGTSPSNASSAETTVTGILNLYTNMSEWSLETEYEETTSSLDDSDDNNRPPRTVHQPKAYRDTIAPLLEHQFSNYCLTVPPASPPKLVASMPKLTHLDAGASITSLRLTSEASLNLQPTTDTGASLSQSLIQTTTTDTTLLPPVADAALTPSFQQYSQSLAQRKVVLEVASLRDAGSSYNQPLSLVSPETDMDNRLSPQSAMSEISVNYERQMAYDTLAPPLTKQSPNMRPVSLVQDDFWPGPESAVFAHVADNKVVPPSDPAQDLPPSRLNEEKVAAQQAQIWVQYNAEKKQQAQKAETKRHPSEARSILHDPIEGPMRTYLTPEPQERKDCGTLSVERPYFGGSLERPSSTFSSDSSGSRGIHETFSRQLKAVWRDKFQRKREKGSKVDANTKREKTVSGVTPDKSSAFNDDIVSYRYPYKLSHESAAMQPAVPSYIEYPAGLNSGAQSSMNSATQLLDDGRSLSSVLVTPELEQKGTLFSHERQRRSPQSAIPLTRYQKYATEPWYESNKKKRRGKYEGAMKAAEVAAQTEERSSPDPEHDSHRASFASIKGHFYSQSSSTYASRPSTEASATPEANDKADSSMSFGRHHGYNDSIFEASGGKKIGGFTNRLLMSSEERRKLKVKESIIVMGSTKMSGCGLSGGSSDDATPLVRL